MEQIHVFGEGGRKLEKDASQSFLKRIGQKIEISQVAFDILEFFIMGDLTVRFESKGEVRWGFVQPSFERFRLGKAIKGHVDLDGVEVLGVKGKPFPLREVFWVESSFPVRIAPPRSPQ